MVDGMLANGEEDQDLDLFGCGGGPVEGRATVKAKSGRNFGSELYELEEKLQAAQILLEGKVQEVDQRVQHLLEEVNDVHKHTMKFANEWGVHITDKLKNYLEIEESQGVFAQLQDEIRVRETGLRTKLDDLESMVKEARDAARGSQARASSPNLTNTHLLKEMGGIKDELHGFRKQVDERFSVDMVKSIRKETLAHLEDAGLMDLTRFKAQHPGGTSEEVLNEVLSSSAKKCQSHWCSCSVSPGTGGNMQRS